MNFNQLSKRRNELMGIAIIATLVFHWKECFEINGQAVPWIAEILSHGNCGVDMFFILSGIGLYYSFTKDSHVVGFYRKRFIRLLPTYFFIAVPYWIIRDFLIDGKDLVGGLQDLFFVTFFSEGVKRFWFIAAIMAFYLVFPWVYKFLFKTSGLKSIEIKFILLLIIAVVFDSLCSMILPIYDNVSIMTGRIPSFVTGIYLGYKSFQKKEIRVVDYLIPPALLVISHIVFQISKFKPLTTHWSGFYQVTLLALTIIEVCLIVFQFVKMEVPCKILRWLGAITLEIYIMHSALKNLLSYPYNIYLYICICIVAPVITGYAIHAIIDRLMKRKCS